MASPSTQLLDTFDRSTLGPNWVAAMSDGSDFTISNGRAVGQTAFSADYWAPEPSEFSDGEAYVTLATPPTGSDIAILWMRSYDRDVGGPPVGNPNGYLLVFAAFSWRLTRSEGGVETNLLIDGTTHTPGDKWWVVFLANQLTVYRLPSGGATWIRMGIAVDPALPRLSKGWLTLEFGGTTAAFDEFGGGEYSYPYQSAFMSLGPRCYWPLVNGSGKALAGNTMTPDGSFGRPSPASSLVRGSPGATYFDATKDHLMYATHDPSIDFDGGVPFTLLWWMRGSSQATFGADYEILTQRDDAGDFPGWQALWGYASSDQISLVFDQGAVGEYEAALADMTSAGSADFIVLAFDGTTLHGYRNGGLIRSNTPDKQIANSGVSVPTYIAANQSGVHTYWGDLSDVGILDYEITDEQVAWLYGAGTGAFPASGSPPTIHGRGAA